MSIQQVQAALAKHPEVELAIVFGSVARGEARRDSDVDVAVQLSTPLGADEKMELIADIAAVTGRPVDLIDLRNRIYAGHFLTTICDIDFEGTKHRVIPRDYQLDPVKDFPIHVDFLRLGEGSLVRVKIPLHITNADQSPGIKRGGTVNMVVHTIEVRCPPDQIPASIDVDIAGKLTNVRLLQSSGNPAHDATIERAIKRSEPLPIPQGKYDKFKQLELHFAG